jgi:hypothetical protein
MKMNGKYLHPLSKALDQLPDEVYWGVMEEIERRPLVIQDLELRKQCEELEIIVNQLMQDASAKITAEDEEY